jgi:calcineurin-like phosphoesterase family protein
MNIFFTSDPHYGHLNIIRYCNRPFQTVEEMDQVIIDNWNSVVKEDDLVYVIGDITMSYKKEKMKNIFDRLNGNKVLIKGNHDKRHTIPVESFIDIVERVRIVGDNYDFVLVHDPAEASANHSSGQKYLCGHLHSLKPDRIYHNWIDIGVDANDFTPISLEQVINLFENEATKEPSIA